MQKWLLLGIALCAVGRGRTEEADCGRDVPLLTETDVVVAGGSSAAVAAACAAADAGARVMLLAPRPYVGDDLCGRQTLWLEPGETPESELARALFPEGRVTTPFTVKRALDQALLKHGVRWLTGCYPTELLLSSTNRASGLIMVNRSGCQAIRAKAVIDATRFASLARWSGAAFRDFAPGLRELQFVVVGGPLRSAFGVVGRQLEVSYKNPGNGKSAKAHPVFLYTAKRPLPDETFATWSRAEHELRDQLCSAGMQDCSEYATCFPSNTLIGEKRIAGSWPGSASCDLAAFRSAAVAGLTVLSAYADVQDQETMLRPLSFMALGARIGASAATEAAALKPSTELRIAKSRTVEADAWKIRGARNVTAPSAEAGSLRVDSQALPVLGDYDVVVVGGGTAGAPAGIGAARSGARTLVIENLDELGGVGTAGVIGSYWYGMRDGFTKEIDEAIGGARRWPDEKKGGWNIVQKSEWLRRELVKQRADVWFGCLGCGAAMTDRKVTGVVVATPMGVGLVTAKTVIDATGNADIADCAGAETQFGVAPNGMLSVQLAGYPQRNLGASENNTCFALVDDTSVVDLWHLMTWTRTKWDRGGPYDAGQLVDSRERRRIVADTLLTTPDILNRRTFSDTISHHKSNFDAAAFPTSPILLIKDMKGPAFEVDLPYRSLLPKGVDGLLVTGLGAGAERDAMTLIRMQPDVQNQGYAAGMAAAMAARNGGHTRNIDLKALQRHLVEQGLLQARVLTDTDVARIEPESLAKAVSEVGLLRGEISQKRTVEDPRIFSLAVVMANVEEALPLLRRAYDEAHEAGPKLTYAKILGVLGDKAGAPALIAALEKTDVWDAGYGLTSHRESDNTFSEQDRIIIALGYSGAPEGLDPLVRKVRQLRPDSPVSHFVATALALRHFARPQGAAEPLAKLLSGPGFGGHACTEAVDAQQRQLAVREVATDKPDTNLNAAFKELLVAGLLVQCGDSQGAGRRVLEQYGNSVNGHFVRYARHVFHETQERRATP